jgi:mannan polymerase II complex MNN10 subunit
MTPLHTITLKVLIAFLTFGIIYQLSHHSPISISSGNNELPEVVWFKDAVKAPSEHGGNDDSTHTVLTTPLTHYTIDSSVIPSSAINYSDMHISYGPTQCMPAFTDHLKQLSLTRNESCTEHAPFQPHESRRVAFASISTGAPIEAYERAILSQMLHTAVHGTSIHILCEELADGAWNKIAFLLHLLMNEMLKPKQERLEWIMWMDRDVIVLDACRPLSVFLPPAGPEFDHINLITNHDAGGLNAGVFLFRVNDWSIELFNTILAFRYFRPDQQLALAEQSAMAIIIQEAKWKKGVVRVPWYWFNAYPDEDDSVEKYRSGGINDLEWFRARKGDFAVHFAGDGGRSGRMLEWHDMLESVGDVWEKGGTSRDVTPEIQKYWDSYDSGSLTDAQVSGEPQNERAMKDEAHRRARLESA